jgi:hypothetical protein
VHVSGCCLPDRANARATATVGNAEGFVQIQVADIRAEVAGTAETHLGIHVRAVHVDLAAFVMADRGQLNLDGMQARQAISILLRLNQDWSGKNDLTVDRARNMRVLKAIYEKFPVDKATQDRTYLFWNLQRGFLAGIGITTLLLLFSSLRLRNPFPLIWTGYLIFLEEIVAELIALKQRRQAENVSPKRIRCELTYEVILLLWAVHIQIRIDNLHLPPGGNDRAK